MNRCLPPPDPLPLVRGAARRERDRERHRRLGHLQRVLDYLGGV